MILTMTLDMERSYVSIAGGEDGGHHETMQDVNSLQKRP